MKTTRNMLTAVMMMAAIGLAAGAARAATIVTPTGASSSTTIGSPRIIDATIDGSDLSSGGLSGDILSETHAPNNDKAGYWLSASGAPSGGEVLEFTIPKSDIDAIHHWVYTRNGETDRGLKTFDISFSTDNGATFPTTITAATLGDFSGPPPVAALLPQSKTFALQSGVTDIRLSNLVNFGDSSYIGLSEIRFGGPEGEVPEPATLVLASLGVLGLGGYARRRR
jgi:hypothetical protein